ncbi:MAG: 5-(carboxyamino)imidazole ribonucleotide synthase [Gemmatimonadota bacterium]
MGRPLESPDLVLGVVGGGQLGRMLAEAAGPLGVDVVVLDPTPEAPASAVARDQIVGGFGEPGALRELAARADVLTYEIELADPELLHEVAADTGVPVEPAPETLAITADKLREKRVLDRAGIPVADFRPVDAADERRAGLEELGTPAMLKAREGGYDGRGNVLVGAADEAEDALRAVGGPAVLEAHVDFERELSVIAVQGADGRRYFPVGENVHEEEILRATVVPARTTPSVRRAARRVAADVLDVLEGRGTIAVEMFEVDGGVLVNEIAPRPHNSGHWSIEGARTSQFAQHVRAVAGRPTGATDRLGPTAMVNVLGQVGDEAPAVLEGVDDVLTAPDATLHWYGKREVRPLRKMGHVTVLGDPDEDVDDVLGRALEYRSRLRFAAPGG